MIDLCRSLFLAWATKGFGAFGGSTKNNLAKPSIRRPNSNGFSKRFSKFKSVTDQLKQRHQQIVDGLTRISWTEKSSGGIESILIYQFLKFVFFNQFGSMFKPPFHGRLTKFHPRHFLVEVIKTRNITSTFIFTVFLKLLINRSIYFNSIVIRLL